MTVTVTVKKKRKSGRSAPTVYLTEEIASELARESQRQDRTPSWLAQQAWKLAKEQIKKMRFEDVDTRTDHK